MELENIRLEKKNSIAIITLNHPPVNAWNLATMNDFARVIDNVETDTETRVVIITGGGEKAFSAGFDVSDAANTTEISAKGVEIWKKIHRFPKPVIAAINGFAMGGGLELALCCTFRVMAEGEKITVGLTELNLGIMPGWGGTQLLKEVVGKARALDMILFSKRIGAQEALDIGLITKKTTPESLIDDAMELAGSLVKRPPLAVECVLNAMSANDYDGLEKGWEIEGKGIQRVSVSKDAAEGFVAFMEKREPVFKGE
jgi:enoyl-CoA hydratase/carnithine racemase